MDRRQFARAVQDVRRYEVRLHGLEVRLTAREFELLVFLIGKRGLVASAEEISEAVWHGPNSTNTVSVKSSRDCVIISAS